MSKQPLKPGDPAPLFTTVTETGEPFSLESLRGKQVILYFYPKDTPGARLRRVVSGMSTRRSMPPAQWSWA